MLSSPEWETVICGVVLPESRQVDGSVRLNVHGVVQ